MMLLQRDCPASFEMSESCVFVLASVPYFNNFQFFSLTPGWGSKFVEQPQGTRSPVRFLAEQPGEILCPAVLRICSALPVRGHTSIIIEKDLKLYNTKFTCKNLHEHFLQRTALCQLHPNFNCILKYFRSCYPLSFILHYILMLPSVR